MTEANSPKSSLARPTSSYEPALQELSALLNLPIESPSEQGESGPLPCRPRRSHRALLLSLVAAFALASFGFWKFVHRKGGTPTATAAATEVLVRSSAATMGDVTQSLDALGTVTPMLTVNVYSQATGQVLAVHYREGQMVHKGDALVDIDPSPYRAQVEQVQGNLDRDRAYLHQAQIDFARYREAFTEHAVSKQILDDQEQALAQYAGAVRNDEGQLAYAQVQLSYCHVIATGSGRVGLRLVDPGNTVFAGGSTPLVSLTSVKPVTVVFNVPEDNLANVRRQMRRTSNITVLAMDRDAQHQLAAGHLGALDNQIDITTGTLRLRAEFANQDLQLYPNEFVTARLQLNTLHGITMVPTSALQRNGAQAFVYVVQNGKAALRPIKEFASAGENTGVSGIQPGEQVITTSFDRLRPGTPIRVEATDASAVPERES